MTEQTVKGEMGFSATWVIKDKHGNIKEQGTDGTEATQKEGGDEEREK